MALLRMEGFDVHEAGDGTEISNVAKNTATATPGLLFGGFGVAPDAFNGFSINCANSSLKDVYVPFPPRNEVYVGFWWLCDDFTGSDSSNAFSKHVFSLGGVYHTLPHISLTVDTNGAGRLLRGRSGTSSGTLILGPSPNGTFVIDRWTRIEMRALIHDTLGEIDFQIDGVNIPSLSGTGLDTRRLSGAAHTDNANWFLFGDSILGSNGGDNRCDSLYVVDPVATPGHPTSFLNNWYVETSYAASDAGPNDFTPVGAGASNADRVNEQPNSNWGTTYNETATPGAIESYLFDPLAVNSVGIAAVQVSAGCRKTSLAHRTARTRIDSNGTVGNGPARAVIGPTYRYNYPQIEVFDPDTGSAWVRAAVDAAEYGFEVVV